MARDPHDEALSWGDENDPTYVPAHPSAPDEDNLDDADRADDIRVVDPFSSSAVAPPLPPAAAAAEPLLPASAAPPAVRKTEPAAAPQSATRPLSVAEQAEAAEDAAAESDLATAQKETQGLNSTALITFGIFGGIFLLYTVGWLVTYIRNPSDPTGLAGIVQNAQNVLAIAAPALWFIVTLLVGAKRKVPVRVIWLIIGVIVLLPWPFLTGY